MQDASTDTVTGLLREQVARRPDAPALFYRNEQMRFRDLGLEVERAAAGLARLGIGEGDRVALWLPNTPAYVVLWLACAHLGAIAVAVNTRFRSAEVADIVGRSGARLLAMWPGFRGIPFLDILAEVPPDALSRLETLVLYDEGQETNVVPQAVSGTRRVRYRDLVAEPGEPPPARARPELGVNVFTTSGTTRAPKFVLHSQRSIARHARTMAGGLGYGPPPDGAGGGGGVLVGLPLCGVFGFCHATTALAGGHPMILMSAFDPGEVVGAIDRHRLRVLNATDDMLLAILEATDREPALPTLEYCAFASFAARPEDVMERASARGLKLVGLYGMSEVQAFYARQPLDAPPGRRMLGGGIPLDPEARVRVRDPESGRLLDPGEQGELELSGPSLMSEYLDNPEATAETFTGDGYVRSGDFGYLHPEGGFVYLARMGDTLRLGGFLVSPAEIEAHLDTHPAVGGSQVVGVQTGQGPVAVAFVVPRAGAPFDEEALREHCRRALARFKVPARILPIDAFPTTPSANGTKIQKAKLREMARAAL